MKEEVFEEILHCIDLPLGTLLMDGTTYRVEHNDFKLINTSHIKELNNFDKFLVLTYKNTVVGGILFYGSIDIQAIVFPEYQDMHFMSTIHKNSILKSECYPNQKVSVSKNTIKSFDDFLMKHYLLSCAGLSISNLSEIHKYFCMFKPCDKNIAQKNSLIDSRNFEYDK